MIKRRNRAMQTVPFKDRLMLFATELREEAFALPPCEQRDNLLKRAGSANTCSTNGPVRLNFILSSKEAG